jgi:SNF2 family DNA or RNA helicase
MPATPAARIPNVIRHAPSIKVTAAYGRIYVTGPHKHLLRRLPGATEHDRTESIMLSLTLETLRAIRTTLGVTQQQMAAYCSQDVLRWARAAGEQERQLLDLHRRIAEGYRREFSWQDKRAHTLVGREPTADEIEKGQVYHTDGCPQCGDRSILDTPEAWCPTCRCTHAVWRWRYRAPFDHQKVMATVATEFDGAAFLCGVGTGKTRAASETVQAKIASGEIDYGLVVCPKGVMKTWERELKNWTDLTPVLLRGAVRDRRAVLGAYTSGAMDARGTVFILNFDALADMQEALSMFMDRRKTMFVEDEMHRLKNPNAAQTQAAMELARHASARLGQTATPCANGAYDVWSQWYTVDLGVTFGANFMQFKREHFADSYDGFTIDPIDGDRTLNRIGQALRLRGLRYRTEDCIALPPKSYEVVEVEMTEPQKRAYREMEEYLITWLRGGATMENGAPATAANQLVAILRLTQITSGFVGREDGTTHFFDPNPKMDALEELVREQVTDGRSVLVWAQYRNDIDTMMRRLANLSPSRIDGTQQGTRGEAEREEAERRFQAGETKLLIGQPGAGGVGLNLQAASVAIYYSQGYSLINREQSEGRCYRSGSDIHNHVTYFDMIVTGTIDDVILAALQSKKDVADAVVDLRRALGV